MSHRPRQGRPLRPFLHRRLRRAPLLLSGALAAALVLAAPAAPAYGQPAEPEPGQPAHGVEVVAYQAHPQLAQLRAEQAWQHSTGAGVTVAVIDSGVDADHPALADRVAPGADFVDGSTDGRVDEVGHGTTVASLIAGQGSGEDGGQAIGLAPEATILPVRVLDNENRYQTAATVAEGVVWAVENGADVINLSLGGARHSPALSAAIELAMANEVVVVACTGNASDDRYTEVWYPAREPGVVAVSGMIWDESGSAAGWSDSLTGPETALAAPAVVMGAQAGGGFRRVQGTSFSAALVAAAAALVLAQAPELSAADVVARLVATADNQGRPGRDPVFGFGVVDPVAALTERVPAVPANPLDTKARHATAGLGAAAPGGAADPPAPSPTRTATGGELVPGQASGGFHSRPSAVLVAAPFGVVLAVVTVLAGAALLRRQVR